MNDRPRTPVHLWIVGIVSLLWNSGGAFDYSATRLGVESYLANFTPEQVEYFTNIPVWMGTAWALGVWGSFFGSFALLLRKNWAVWLFGVSILGLAGTTVYNFVLTDGAEIMGDAAAAFSVAIWTIVLFLFFYARAMAKRGVLR
jgi:hypothetical protein